MRQRLRQLASFCIVGLACFGISLAVLTGLHQALGVQYLLAYVAAFVTGNAVGYLMNGRLTFAVRLDHGGVVRYMVLNLGLLCVNSTAMKLLVGTMGLWYVSAAVVLAALNAPISFFAQRFFTYRLRGDGSPTRA